MMLRRHHRFLPWLGPRMTATDTSPLAYFVTDEAWKRIGIRLRLTKRELQVVRSLCSECREPAVAASLNVSPHTIRTHLERIYTKLGVTGRVDLMLLLLGTFLVLTAEPGSKLPPICGRHSAGHCPFCP